MSFEGAALNEHRGAFPALVAKTYLNFGGHGPLPQVARQAIEAAYDFEQTQGPFCTKVNDWTKQVTAQVRAAIAGSVGTTPDRIALTESTTAGMNIPLWGIDWRAKDQILTSDAEHPGVIAILKTLGRRFGVELVVLPLMHSPDPVAELEAHFNPRVRMVVLSHVLWNTGRVLPIAAMASRCHQQGILLHVDAAQAAGVLPLNLPELGVDFYAFTCHKWLCGPAGTGALYVSAEAQPQLQPTYTGWRALQATGTAAEYEVATSAWSLLAGLLAALQWQEQFGSSQARYARQVRLAGSLWQRLGQMPGVTRLSSDPPQAGLVSFQLPGWDPPAAEAALAERGVLIRCLSDPACLRASVHYFSSESDLEHLAGAVEQLQRQR